MAKAIHFVDNNLPMIAAWSLIALFALSKAMH